MDQLSEGGPALSKGSTGGVGGEDSDAQPAVKRGVITERATGCRFRKKPGDTDKSMCRAGIFKGQGEFLPIGRIRAPSPHEIKKTTPRAEIGAGQEDSTCVKKRAFRIMPLPVERTVQSLGSY